MDGRRSKLTTFVLNSSLEFEIVIVNSIVSYETRMQTTTMKRHDCDPTGRLNQLKNRFKFTNKILVNN